MPFKLTRTLLPATTLTWMPENVSLTGTRTVVSVVPPKGHIPQEKVRVRVRTRDSRRVVSPLPNESLKVNAEDVVPVDIGRPNARSTEHRAQPILQEVPKMELLQAPS